MARGRGGSAAHARLSLVVDLNLPPLLAQRLTDRGVHAVHWDDSPSVIQIRLHDLTAAHVAVTVEQVVRVHHDVLHAGALVSVSDAGARVRMLPLRRGRDG